MQHLGTEDELEQTLNDLIASLPLEKRLAGVSAEQVVRALPPEELERLRNLLLSQEDEHGPGSPK